MLTLEAVASVTSQPAQTPHEQLFHHRYGRVISEGIAALRNFGADGTRNRISSFLRVLGNSPLHSLNMR